MTLSVSRARGKSYYTCCRIMWCSRINDDHCLIQVLLIFTLLIRLNCGLNFWLQACYILCFPVVCVCVCVRFFLAAYRLYTILFSAAILGKCFWTHKVLFWTQLLSFEHLILFKIMVFIGILLTRISSNKRKPFQFETHNVTQYAIWNFHFDGKGNEFKRKFIGVHSADVYVSISSEFKSILNASKHFL